jgi:hypothetical protein
MGLTNTGTRSNPQAVATGVTPTFAADLSGVSDFFAARSFRNFDTVAHIASSSGSGSGEWAKCDATPGALYWFNASSGHWQLGNQPAVANATARDALFSGTIVPVEGNEVYDLALAAAWRYTNGAWILWSKGSTAFTPTFAAGFSLGNGTMVASYKIVDGDVVGLIQITAGSTTTWTSGSISPTVPFGTISAVADGVVPVGDAFYLDTSASNRYEGKLFNTSSAGSMLPRTVATGSVTGWLGSSTAGSNVPSGAVIATGDILVFRFMYTPA